MNNRIALGLGVLALVCPPPDQPPVTTNPPQVVVTDPPIVPCPPTTWSSWADIPGCDLNGSQTWILSDEQTDLEWIGNLRSYCEDAGGVYAWDSYDPPMHYCIDVDY